MKEYWYEQVIKANGNNIIIGIVGNKCDLYNKEKVEESAAKEWAESHGCIFQLTSAFQGTGIKDIFKSVCAKLVEIKTNKKKQIQKIEEEDNKNLVDIKNPKHVKPNKKCC